MQRSKSSPALIAFPRFRLGYATLLVFLLAGLAACKQDCDDLDMGAMVSGRYEGQVYVCNGEPNASTESCDAVVSLSGSNVGITLACDSAVQLNYNLAYFSNCELVEKDIPVLYLVNGAGGEMGQFNVSPDRISFTFQDGNCDNVFEGIKQ